MKLVIVDDDLFILETIQRMLADQGHEITALNNVDDAIAHLERDGVVCDLVITDVVMPEKDGLKLAQFVKAQKPEIPVLAITAGVENALDDYAYMAEMFADAVMTKPLKKDSFIEKINALAA